MTGCDFAEGNGACHAAEDAAVAAYISSAAFANRQAQLGVALRQGQASQFTYHIEVSGVCNLRCPSCPVGNTPTDGPPKTFMDPELFTAIITKIRKEQLALGRQRVRLDLYNWGEPLLHPNLPQFIETAMQAGFTVGVSTNLNYGKRLDALAAAAPAFIRISVSGFFQETYGRTHRGGNIETVKANMVRLRHALDAHHSLTPVEVGYIAYRHNVGRDLALMAALCGQLDFKFSKDCAALMPLERLLEAIETGHVPPEIADILPLDPQRVARLSKPFADAHTDCNLRKSFININSDGSVPLCCALWDRAYDVAGNYLVVSESDIQKARYDSTMCRRCMSRLGYFTYNAIHVPPVRELIREALGA
jgi:hypothetical protein